MWQRIQTVFLVIAILSLIGAILFPIWAYADNNNAYQLFALNYMQKTNDAKTHLYIPYTITGVLFIAAITVAFIQITKFKNRLLQIKLGTLNSLLMVAGYASAVYFASTLLQEKGGGTYGLGMWLPAVAVFCNWLAMRFIRKDEKLVRDSERLR